MLLCKAQNIRNEQPQQTQQTQQTLRLQPPRRLPIAASIFHGGGPQSTMETANVPLLTDAPSVDNVTRWRSRFPKQLVSYTGMSQIEGFKMVQGLKVGGCWWFCCRSSQQCLCQHGLPPRWGLGFITAILLVAILNASGPMPMLWAAPKKDVPTLRIHGGTLGTDTSCDRNR